MLKKFKTFQLAIEFHQLLLKVKTPVYLKDQLQRASSSVALNLAEGSGKQSAKDQSRFYQISFGSLQEVYAILIILNIHEGEMYKHYFHLSCSIKKLIDSRSGG
jgi:four helix bundle protein